jgi:heat-inducible transcriptional repressor
MNVDETHLPELTRRQEEILSLIVRAYTQQPEPVSSKNLVEAFNLSYSSATVRNEMAALEEFGYISAPHTSAGRVPTQNGYRYFVKRLISPTDLSPIEQTRISEKLQSTPLATENWMRIVAAVLARTAQTAALVTPPIAESRLFKHLELIAIQGRLILMVLVLQEGAVHQQMLTLAEPIAQPRLSEIAARINGVCVNLGSKDIRLKSAQLGVIEQEILELVADMIDRAESARPRVIYREGLSDVISIFPSSEGAQQAVRVFEERAYLNIILDEILKPFVNDVQVVIAGDGRWEQLSHLTMVLSRYGIPGTLNGAVGVVGPMHINYARAISAVSYVASMMTSMLTTATETPKDSLPEPDEE